MINFLLLILLNAGIPSSNIKKSLEKRYIKQVFPYIVNIWDKNVISMANMFTKNNNRFNNKKLIVSLEMNITSKGKVVSTSLVASSGYDPFDDTAIDAISSITSLPSPPNQIISDDGVVHLFWTLRRGRPYSSIKYASVRYVKYSDSLAIKKFLKQGLIKKSWKRLYKSMSKEIKKKPIFTFIRGIFLHQFPPSYLSSVKMKQLFNYLQEESFPVHIFIPWLKLISDDDVFRQIGKKIISNNHALGCEFLNSTLDYSAKRTIWIISEIISQNKATTCFNASFINTLKHSSNNSIQLMGVALEIRNSKRVNTKLVQNLKNSYSGQYRQDVAIAMGISGKNQFLNFLMKKLKTELKSTNIMAIVNSIAMMKSKKAGFALLNLLKNKNPDIQIASVRAIPLFKGAERAKIWKFCTWELGTLLLKTNNNKLRTEIAKTIIKITQGNLSDENNKHYYFLVLRNRHIKTLLSAIKLLSPQIKESKKKLIRFLKSPSEAIVYGALLRLIPVSDLPSVKKAVLSIKSKNHQVQDILKIFKLDKTNFMKINSRDITVSFILNSKKAKINSLFIRNRINKIISNAKKKKIAFTILPLITGLYLNGK